MNYLLTERRFDMAISMDWRGRLGVPYQGPKEDSPQGCTAFEVAEEGYKQ